MLAVAVGIGLASTIVGIVTIILYCIWQYRVHSNARVFSSQIRFTPGWGVGYWFIPIINFFRPYQVMRAIDAATPADDRPIANMIGVWWVSYVFGIVTSVASGALGDRDGMPTILSTAVALVSSALGIISLLLILRIIRSITERQAAHIGA
jgi:hypothetical protein